MSTDKDNLTEDTLMERARARMERIINMNERADRGEATESEIAELKALDERINSVPDDVIRG